jgi:hypothetical protein
VWRLEESHKKSYDPKHVKTRMSFENDTESGGGSILKNLRTAVNRETAAEIDFIMVWSDPERFLGVYVSLLLTCSNTIDQAILGHGGNGDTVLWTLSTTRSEAVYLTLGDISGDRAQVVKSVDKIAALCIIPVQATRGGLVDILILRPLGGGSDGSLVLWTGHLGYFPCKIKDDEVFETKARKREADDGENSPVAKVLRSPSKAARVVGMRENVDDRVCFKMSSGREFRAVVRFEPLDCVTRACVEALRR